MPAGSSYPSPAKAAKSAAALGGAFGARMSYWFFQELRKSASKIMSASRISPVIGFTRDGPMANAAPAVIQRKVL